MNSEFESLTRNALDFLERSVVDLEKGTAKYSVINFYSGLELILKARLLKEHWALCARKVGENGREVFASGDFESIGLEEAKTRLANIVNCKIQDSEATAYDRLRKRRNQGVHFFHPDDLSSTPKVAVEQLMGWYWLYRRLTGPWKEIFEPFLEAIEQLQARLVKRQEYFPTIYAQLAPEMELRNKSRLRSDCDFCKQPSALTLGKVGSEVHRLECFVCSAETFRVFLPCRSCGKPAPRSFEQSLLCQWCGTENQAALDDPLPFAEQLNPKAWCAICGYLPSPSVVALDGASLCLACYTFEQFSTITRCDWCGDTVTGRVGDRLNPGCVRCGFHIQNDADSDLFRGVTYIFDRSEWPSNREMALERWRA